MCTPNTSQSSVRQSAVLDCFSLLILLLYTLHESTFEVLFKMYKTLCVLELLQRRSAKNTDAY